MIRRGAGGEERIVVALGLDDADRDHPPGHVEAQQRGELPPAKPKPLSVMARRLGILRPLW